MSALRNQFAIRGEVDFIDVDADHLGSAFPEATDQTVSRATDAALATAARAARGADAEARRLHRHRVLKRATIIKSNTNSEVSCTIRNQHASGAELKVPADMPVPVKFLLYVPVDGLAYCAEVRWRGGERIGVQFSGTAPKPRLHYG